MELSDTALAQHAQDPGYQSQHRKKRRKSLLKNIFSD
jgi:hypothetical protein